MKKTFKRITAVLMSVMLAATTFLFGGVSSLGAVTTYEAGPNITASFDSSTGTLTFTGTGATYDFRNTTSPTLGTKQTPWSSVKPNITSVVVGEGITTIGDYCFYNCTALTSVSLPSTLKAINGSGTRDGQTTSFGAFRDCTALTSITFPEGLETIGTVAFRGCTALSSVTFPDSVTSIGAASFTGCTSLRTVTFGSGITEVPLEAFYNDTNIKYINWGENITTIGEWAFYNCGMTEVDIPDSITTISARGFADCYFLLKATIHNIQCSIATLSFNNTKLTASQDFTVVGHTGSTAQTFAEDRGYTFISLDDCTHSSTTVNTVIQATCTEKGKTETVCNDCGQLVSWSEVAALGHDYQTVSTSDDTAVDGHIRTYTKCSRCSDEKTNITHAETEESTTLRKKYVWVDGFYTTSSRGNCQTGVITTYSCSVEGCNAVQVMDAVTSGHTVESWTVTKEPTCTETGSKTGHCTKCDTDVVEDIPATGHEYADVYIDIVDKTEEDGHVYRYYPCNNCDAVNVVPEHRDWVELMYTPNVVLSPTCTTGGRRVDTCDICGEQRTIDLPNNGGHDWVETSHEDATCTAKGQTNYQCSKCSLTKKENTDALGHDLIKTEGGSKLPTCTEDGYNSYECSRCSYSNQEVVPALGHESDPNAYKLVVPPTCEEGGSAASTCTVCKENYTIDVDPLGHDYQTVNTQIEEQPGHYLATPTCTRCGAVQSAEKLHVEWIDGYYESNVINEANCVTGQNIQDTCTLCGTTRVRTEGAGLGHELQYLRLVNTTGTITYTCKHCALVSTAKAADVYLMWDDAFYNTVPSGRVLENDSTYLDVNGDNFINAKDFALLRNLYKKSLEPETPTDSTEEGTDTSESTTEDTTGEATEDTTGNETVEEVASTLSKFN
ncbi:MAG: leucine-rich repeat protein [Eubacterium sp.]